MTLGIGLQLTGCGSHPLLRSKAAVRQQQRSSADGAKTNPYDTIAIEKYKYGEGLFDLFRTDDGELYFSRSLRSLTLYAEEEAILCLSPRE